jgi:hypothetical protein
MLKKVLIIAMLVLLILPGLIVSAQANGDKVCPGSPPTRMVGETQGQVARSFSSLRDGVASNKILRILRHHQVFDMLDGPVCDTTNGKITWWQVSYDGQTGWVSEGADFSIWGRNQYWIEPVSDPPPPPPPPTCNASPATRLDGATQGEVAQRFSSIRAAIGSANVLKVMPGGAVFDILDGPVCAGPHYWYQVSYQGTTGWSTEGYRSTYWLEPVDED